MDGHYQPSTQYRVMTSLRDDILQEHSKAQTMRIVQRIGDDQEAFDELMQLAVLDAHLTQVEALEALQHLVNQTIFQAQKTTAPIQISGLLEASGCEFDSLWIMGLTDQCLPQKVRWLSDFQERLFHRTNLPTPGHVGCPF